MLTRKQDAGIDSVRANIGKCHVLNADAYQWNQKMALKLVREAQKSCAAGNAKLLKDWSDLDV